MVLLPWEAGKFTENDENTRTGPGADDDHGASPGPRFGLVFCLWLVSPPPAAYSMLGHMNERCESLC